MKKMIYGADLGWASQLESMGYRWLNRAGNPTDIFSATKELGVNAVRLRVFVDPPRDAFWQKRETERCMLGFCDPQSVLEMAKRVTEQGLDLMIGFHYSDVFADPEIQEVPEAWRDASEAVLEERVAAHTREVMSLLKENGVIPRWVQVGNEINHGILWPEGRLEKHPEALVRYLNVGYDAVKEVSPDSLVVTHLAMISKDEMCEPFLENFFGRGGKTDILGFSYYPYWDQFESSVEFLTGKLKKYAGAYQKPVLIAEVGAPDDDDEGAYRIVADAVGAMKKMEQQECAVFYWEPEATREILPDRYPLSASRLAGEKLLRYNKALQAYRDDAAGVVKENPAQG